MFLGSIAPKSEEEGKPTYTVELTAVEMQAMAILSNMRFQLLFDAPGEEARRMCGIYLGVTAKLSLGLLQASIIPEGTTKEVKEEPDDRV
jgi:hypothetical protein